MKPLQPVRGTHDLLPEEYRHQHWITETARQVSQRFGFEPIETPIFEFTDVFARSLGETSDVVHKEMYTFEDRGGESLTLRPEGTASVARAFLSQGLKNQSPVKFFYEGPMFRYERPQKGRMRQFHQIGVELMGVDHIHSDLELLSMSQQIFSALEIPNKVSLEINSIGDAETRAQYRKVLTEFLGDKKDQLSADSQTRFKSNPLRILDSKNEGDQKLLESAPSLQDHLTPESYDRFEKTCEGLQQMGISYTVNPRLVRGLDYYRHLVFEFKCNELGAQNTVLAGGRYDGLMEFMGGPPTPGVGWAAGLERLALITQCPEKKPRPHVLVPLDAAAESQALQLSHKLRQQGLVVEMTYSGNMSKRMKKAHKMNALTAVIIGATEVENQSATVKELKTGNQQTVSWKDLASHLKLLKA